MIEVTGTCFASNPWYLPCDLRFVLSSYAAFAFAFCIGVCFIILTIKAVSR